MPTKRATSASSSPPSNPFETGKETVTDPNVVDLKALRADLLIAETELALSEVRVQTAEAEIKELDLAARRDAERDRQVRSGLTRRLPVEGIMAGHNILEWIDALEHWEQRDPGQPVTVIIDSPGGDVMGGFALFDAIMRLRRKGHFVTTRGRGMVASMATVLLQAGDERVLDANTSFMLHEISFRTGGKLSEIEDDQIMAKRLQDRLLKILAERSTLTTGQIQRRWKKKDVWMDAEECLKLGFIDRIE